MKTKEELAARIAALKKEKNAIILAHYYCTDEVQALADHVGDSFYLAKVAKETDAAVIVFCGVSFMGESAKILNPEKTVLMPDLHADCAMAHMAEVERIKEMRAKYPGLAVVCYINSTAELKRHSDVCVTSSNAVRIVRALPNRDIYFIPDQNLGRFVKEQVPEKNVMLCDGYCPIHKALTADQVLAKKREYPEALVLTHPECTGEVLALSDYVGSTADIIRYAKESEADCFIVCTEVGVAYRLRQDNPQKRFVFCDPCPCCADMKLNTPEKIEEVLSSGKNAVEVSEEKRAGALVPLDRMLELAK
ncbi:MAG: quinolinate synthase NadA [Ruminococcaceae bacterium]|nr:quinolinate synthase NadA [Oscillospiraceae bacterium]